MDTLVATPVTMDIVNGGKPTQNDTYQSSAEREHHGFGKELEGDVLLLRADRLA